MLFVDENIDEHLTILKQIEALPESEVSRLRIDENLWGLRLPEDVKYDMTLSGWLYSRLLDSHIPPTTQIGHWATRGFISFSQFSLVAPGSRPCFVASGEKAKDALEIIKVAFSSFTPTEFDSDGYKIESIIKK
jgi:hypothetical protein